MDDNAASDHTRDGNREPELDASRFPFKRPTTRADCQGGYRPCPYIACRNSLVLDVGAGGRLTFNTSGAHKGVNADATDERFQREADALVEEWFGDDAAPRPSCALDVVEASPDGLTGPEIGDLFNLSRERVRQIESTIGPKLRPLLAVLTGRTVAV